MKKLITLLALFFAIAISISSCKKSSAPATTSSNSNNNTTSGTWTNVSSPGVVGNICFDPTNNLFVAQACIGVRKYDGTSWTTFSSPTLTGNYVYCIASFNNAIYTHVGTNTGCPGTAG